MNAEAMFKLARDGKGRIVSSGDLCIEAISEAQACKRFFVDADGFGFAYLPWELTTDKDREREKTFSETNGQELVALRAMQDGVVPELVHALRELVETLERVDPGVYDLENAKAALAKAT